MTFTLTNTTQHTDSGNGQTSVSANQTSKDAHLTYPSAETDYRIMRAVVPVGSKWTAGLHWHETHDEVLRVVKGRAKIRLGNEYKILTPEDGEIIVPKFVVHDVMRADVDAKEGEGDDEELWMEERSDPVDGSKELFFRHIFSVMADQKAFGWKFPLQMLLTCMYSDGYLVIVPGPAHWYITHGIYAAVKTMAQLAGLSPFYDEYTPERLQGIRRILEEGGKNKSD